MKEYSVEEIQGEYSVVRTTQFLFWTTKRYLVVTLYFTKSAFMWFGTFHSKPTWWTPEHHTFDTKEEAQAAVTVCEQLQV